MSSTLRKHKLLSKASSKLGIRWKTLLKWLVRGNSSKKEEKRFFARESNERSRNVLFEALHVSSTLHKSNCIK